MRGPRRIVAGLDRSGQSCVVAEDALPGGDGAGGGLTIANLWTGPVDRVANDAPVPHGFPPFGMEQMTQAVCSWMLAEYPPGLGRDDPGMHRTDTADHFYIIEGEVVLVLENGDVILRAGDAGICRGVMHGWRNDGDAPARLITFVLPAEPLERRV